MDFNDKPSNLFLKSDFKLENQDDKDYFESNNEEKTDWDSLL